MSSLLNILPAVVLALLVGAAHGTDAGLTVWLLCQPCILLAKLLFDH